MKNKIKEIRDEIRYRIYKLKFRLFGIGPGPVRRILSNQDGVGTVEVVLLILEKLTFWELCIMCPVDKCDRGGMR